MEVFQDGERVFTSASHDTMDQIQSFTAESGGVLVQLGTKVRGNIQVIIHHIRAIPIARKANLVSGGIGVDIPIASSPASTLHV